MPHRAKHIVYAVLIERQLKQIFKEDCENFISLDELAESDENTKAFFHALSTMVPTSFFNRLVGDTKDHLSFNHLSNGLCFEFCKTVK